MATRKICQIERCPEKTHGRLVFRKKRVDLCLGHFDSTLGHYNGKGIKIIEEWGERPPVIQEDVIDDVIAKINKSRSQV